MNARMTAATSRTGMPSGYRKRGRNPVSAATYVLVAWERV